MDVTHPQAGGQTLHGHEPSGAGGASGEHGAYVGAEERSIWPVTVALGVLLMGIGVLAWLPIAILGAVVVVVAIGGWLWQPWTPT